MRRTAFALTAISLLTGAAFAADAANLGPTFKQGDVSRYELSTKSTQFMKAPQGEMTVNVETSVVLRCEVTEVNDQGATVVATIEGVDSVFESPFLTDSFDSAAPAEKDAASQLAPLVRPVIGKSFTVTFDAAGANADVRGVNQFIPQGPAGQLVAQAIGAQGLGNAVVGMYVLKDGHDPVAVGTTWDDRQEAPAPPLGTLSITTTSELSEIANDVAKVVVEGKATLTPDPNAAPGMTMTIDESVIDGVILWDTNADMLRQLTSNNVLVLGATPMGMDEAKQTIRIVNTSTTRRLD